MKQDTRKTILTCPSRDELAAAEASCGKPTNVVLLILVLPIFFSSFALCHFLVFIWKPLNAGGGTQGSGSCREPAKYCLTFVCWTPHHLSLLLGVVVVDFSEAKFRLERHSLH